MSSWICLESVFHVTIQNIHEISKYRYHWNNIIWTQSEYKIPNDIQNYRKVYSCIEMSDCDEHAIDSDYSDTAYIAGNNHNYHR
jgi:hypothetical protein